MESDEKQDYNAKVSCGFHTYNQPDLTSQGVDWPNRFDSYMLLTYMQATFSINVTWGTLGPVFSHQKLKDQKGTFMILRWF